MTHDPLTAAQRQARFRAKRDNRIKAMEEALGAVQCVRDGYKSQMKFCDIEALGYFREFVRRIDAAMAALGGDA